MNADAEVVEELGALDHVADAWDALADAARLPPCSAAWLVAWARQHVEPGMLRVAVVREGDEIIGIVPGAIVRGRGGARSFKLLGSGTASGISPLARAGCEAQVAGLAAAALADRGPRLDAVKLDGIPADSPWPALLARVWPGARSGLLREERVDPEPLISLQEDDFEAWMSARSGNFRSQVRRAQRALEKGGGQIRRTTDPADLERDVAAFVGLHEARWESRGGSSVINADVEQMLAEACPRLLAQDRLDLWCVDYDGRTVGAQLWLRGPAISTMWLSGTDDRQPAVRPTMLIVVAAVQDAYERGLDCVSLGGGDMGYKQRYADSAQALGWWSLPLPGPRLPLVLGQVEAGRARRAVGQRMTPARKQQLRSVVEKARLRRPAPR